MAPQLKSRLNGFIFIFVFFPLALVLVIFNLQLWGQVNTSQYARVNELLDDASMALEAEVREYRRQIQLVGSRPEIRSALRADERANPEGLSVAELLAQLAGRPSSGEDVIRAAETGPAAAFLRELAQADAAVKSILLVDVLGVPVAATFTPESDSYRPRKWYSNSLRQPPGEPLYTGVFDNDTFWISSTIWKEGEERVPLGVIRLEMDVGKLLLAMPFEPPAERGAILLVGPQNWYPKGAQEVVNASAGRVMDQINRFYSDYDYVDGYRYSRQFVLESANFENGSLRMVAILREPLIASAMQRRTVFYGFMSIAILLGVMLASRVAAGRIADQNTEVISAGAILLSRLHPDAPNRTNTGSGMRGKESARINAEFDNWIEQHRQSVLDNMETHEFEMQRDLELARDFQLAYLDRPYPKVPDVHVPGRMRLKFHHRYKPAMALGGDFFEITKLSHDCAGLFISDVMGHGTRSALITSILRTLIGDTQSHGRNARHFMTEINKGFCTLLDNVNLPHPLFASAFYFVADTTARAATFSTAGHPPPYQLRRYGHSLERLNVAPPHGAALGISSDEEYTGGATRLNVGDVFFFFTDGMYEAFNPLGQELGLRAIERVIRNKMHNHTEEILDAVIQAVEEFTGHEPLHDDICLVAIEVTDEPEEDEEEAEAVQEERLPSETASTS